MAILRSRYDGYIVLLEMTKKRIKRDRLVVKIISSMINKKKLSQSDEFKLQSLLKDN